MAENSKAAPETVAVKLLQPVYTAPNARPLPIGTVTEVAPDVASFWVARRIAVRIDDPPPDVKVVTGGDVPPVTPAPMPAAPPLKAPDPASLAPPH
ncbi:MAG: hypothetical protein ABF665_06625 [Gluconacetobacter sp.]